MKLLAIIEAGSVTGPAKNLLAFCQTAPKHSFANLPGIETSILTFRRASAYQPFDAFVEQAKDLRIPIEVIEERFRFDRRVLDNLKRVVERQRPDLIQTHNVKSHFLIRLSGLWRKIPWIAFHHGYTTTDLKMRAYNQLDRWSLPKAHRVVTVNQPFADHLVQKGAQSTGVRILHNAVDTDSLAEVCPEEAAILKASMGIAEHESIIIAIGRMSLEKGHSDLLKAFARLVSGQIGQKSKLLLIGDGPERERLMQETLALKIADRVIFTGQVQQTRAFYSLADLLVLPSHSEGSPNVLLEAMAARVPVVATAVGGVPEIVTDHKEALLVESGDTEALARAMTQLMNDRKLAERLADNAHRRAVKKYSPAARLRSLLEIYQELTPRPALKTSPIA